MAEYFSFQWAYGLLSNDPLSFVSSGLWLANQMQLLMDGLPTPPPTPFLCFLIGGSFYLPKKHLTFRIWNMVAMKLWWVLYLLHLSQHFCLPATLPLLSFTALAFPFLCLAVSFPLCVFSPQSHNASWMCWQIVGCLVGHYNAPCTAMIL